MHIIADGGLTGLDSESQWVVNELHLEAGASAMEVDSTVDAGDVEEEFDEGSQECSEAAKDNLTFVHVLRDLMGSQ